MDDNHSSEDSLVRESKVNNLIKKYGLSQMEDYLVSSWLGESREKYSLRRLSREFNKSIVKSALKSAGMEPLDQDVESIVGILKDTTASSGVKTQMRNRLDNNGINPQELEDDFVSHQAIHTYLTKYLGVELPSNKQSSDSRRKSAEKTVQRLQGRSQAVLESTMDSLNDSNDISICDYDIFVDMTIRCKECGDSYGVDQLLQNGACSCE